MQNGDIADATVAEREEILKLTQGRFNAGLENGSRGGTGQGAAGAGARWTSCAIAAQREMDVHAIAALAGQGAAAYATITRPDARSGCGAAAAGHAARRSAGRRPDILAARARVDAAAKGREAAHADFYPDINLAALAGFQAIGLSNLFTGNAFTMGAGPGDPSADLRCRQNPRPICRRHRRRWMSRSPITMARC